MKPSSTIQFAFFKLGKFAIPECKLLDSKPAGSVNETLTVKLCLSNSKFPKEWELGNYVFLWLGSDNNTGTPTSWKQGIKAIAKSSTTPYKDGDGECVDVKVLYIFPDAINILSLLKNAPSAYYWCCSMPFINPMDHANQSARLVRDVELSDPKAFFYALSIIDSGFENSITEKEPELEWFFEYEPQDPSGESKKERNITRQNIFPLQQIFYGAPGTGKSFHVDEVCKKYKHYRTTFHPDSDYSTFVGCYKPVKENMKTATKDDVLDRDNLVARLKEYRNLYDETQAQTQFGYDYYESLRDRSDIGEILRDAAGKTFDTCIRVGMALAERNTPKTASSKITYDFVPQTFINAYIEAWRDLTKPVFLVIEEINRGNCAQIFGDLFQLLDRNEEGYSSYEIEPNTDLKNYIADQGLEISEVVDEDGNDISGKLMSGDLMALTPNLHIWATMNTSDQSLFPIDSAFKRRWDWKYMPINTEAKKGWSIKVNGVEYSWSSFLNNINSEIEDTTSSEDKQLGFFFCKADDTDEDGNNGVITAERFVSKVLFYLYNDVFKDYGFEREFFKDKENNNKLITFRSLFNMGGDINEERVELLLNNLEVEIVKNNIDEEDGGTRVSDTNAPYRVTFPDGVVICEDSGWETYIASLRKIGLDKALPFGEMYSRRNKTLPLITDKKIEDQGVYKYYEIDGYYVLSGTDSQHRLLNRINKDLNLGLTIE